MPYNPNIPLDDSLMVAGEMRSQFTGLKTLIDQVPAGPPGPAGPQGAAGAQGPQGVPGEVSHAQLDGAILTTAVNPSGFGPFEGGFSEPPTQGELQNFAAWVDALRNALVR